MKDGIIVILLCHLDTNLGRAKMNFYVHAACACDIGNVRKNNEDNFLFNDEYLDEINLGLKKTLTYEEKLTGDFCVAVFDGMGGENFGEVAAFTAAQKLKEEKLSFIKEIISNDCFENVVNVLNDSVVEKKQQLLTEKMGTTFVSVWCLDNMVKVCNIGDSRAYIFRDGKLSQLSSDHIEKRQGKSDEKCGLTQFLGFNTDEVDLDPYTVEINLNSDDLYLLCSDGLSDMLTDDEISNILEKNTDTRICAETLIDSAKENGGRDNITVIICRFIERGQ